MTNKFTKNNKYKQVEVKRESQKSNIYRIRSHLGAKTKGSKYEHTEAGAESPTQTPYPYGSNTATEGYPTCSLLGNNNNTQQK